MTTLTEQQDLVDFGGVKMNHKQPHWGDHTYINEKVLFEDWNFIISLLCKMIQETGISDIEIILGLYHPKIECFKPDGSIIIGVNTETTGIDETLKEIILNAISNYREKGGK